jgi:hypothetical protein
MDREGKTYNFVLIGSLAIPWRRAKIFSAALMVAFLIDPLKFDKPL